MTKLSPQEDDDYSDEDIDTSHTAITMRDKRPVVHAQDNFKPSDNIANSEQLTSDEESLEARPKQPGISRAVATRLAEDDADIKALERKLGMKGSGKNSNPLDGNGLDDLLGTLGSPASEDDKIKKRRRDEGDDWLREKRKKARLRSDTNTRHDIFPNVERKNFEHCSTPRDALQGDMSEECEDDEFSGFDVYETASLVSASKLRENPYLPPRTSLGNTASKYVPPSLRMQDSSNQESLTKLKRQIQGTLNRLAEANMLGIVRDIQGLYRQNPRQHVSSLLLDCLFGLICDVSPLSDTFMILHGGFVAALHRTLGMEFAAQAVQRVAENFEGFTPRQARGGETGKQLSNLITFLAELYNFQVVGSGLIYDYIRIFVADLSEEHTELLLKIARLSGPQLRQDDPSSLKDTVALIQSAVAKTGFDALSVRSKFMIETIENLKNNRMKTGFAASSVTSEHTVRMKKVLASISQGSARSSEPLRITLRDIQNSNKKGRWWLIGASYRDGGANAPNNIATKSSIQGTSAEDEQDLDAATDLLQLAREQRMNTDVRRSIFVSILSSTDYRDATQRLLKLRLKKAQELEIPKVILRCAGAEKSYNPFYTLISRELCKDHRIRMAFQFCLWDEFKGMEEDEKELEDDFGDRLDMRALVNLARMFGTLVADSKLGISLFKVRVISYCLRQG